MTNTLLTALRFANANICVVPVANDGSKRPGLSSWVEYQKRLPTANELLAWFAHLPEGIGIICGEISGNLEMLELEGRAVSKGVHLKINEMANQVGIGHIWDKITNGYTESTPSGGIHWLYRVQGQVPGSTKLARQPGENGAIDVLAETKGEGGFVITAPSSGKTHPSSGAWVMVSGSPETIATITLEERDELHKLFKTFDSMPRPEIVAEEIKTKNQEGLSPGDDYNAKTTWESILEPLGWKKVYTKNDEIAWRRPNKSEGISATTNFNGNDKLYVFSTSTIFEAEQSYSKFAAFTHLNYQDDFRKSAQALRQQGYGSIRVAEPIASYNPTTGEMTPAMPLALAEGSREEEMLAFEVMRLRARRLAERIVKAEEASRDYKEPIFVRTLQEELELPEEEVKWVIKDIFPFGANISITAQYKAGKTTLVNSLTKSLVDGIPFLNYFRIPEHKGRVVIFNYEVTENQYRRWMRDVSIQNRKDVTIVHLRGERLPIISQKVQDLMVGMLADLECSTWVLDPFARAFVGSGDENSNSEVGVFLDTLDVIKKRAGVDNLILPMHTGRAQEHGIDRARGATRLDDWADVRWLLSKTDEGRFFSADGRDVMLEQQQLKFDEASRALTLGGSDAKTAKKRSDEDRWVEIVEANPGKSTNELFALLGVDSTHKRTRSGMASALRYKRVKVSPFGTSKLWYPINYVQSYTQAEVG